MKKRYVVIAMMVLCATLAAVIYVSIEKERYSKEFANNLFKYTLPPHTQTLERHYFYGYSFGHLMGSGGEMPVVANMKLSTSLSKEEILNYYKNAPLFPFPNSKNSGVEIEVYLSGESKLHKKKDGFYFSGKDDSLKRISSYKNNVGYTSTPGKKTQQFVLQISSSFDYLIHLDR
ncbi:hypothetical protein [Priestia megaterium]|uniref:Uncharacterized protein n=1 Tax=Priestia megaterium TaxID=1404 RepID=A0A6M6E486_PRIMG|nr:hypothetical protein [Priestia megaterium]QJX80414.1 hypothetical protein FDZ14_30470 [Priestia megaterium]